ncbi:PilZ domain-containing protein [Novosphingobium sp.]|uniref:PilZ domain-containing protein n=1 Tax=Novosphingobium sp. TaxID=1874826 RepID=UPI002FDD5DC3
MSSITWQIDYEAAASDDRCAPRARLVIPSKMRRNGGRAAQTMVLDLSLAGFSALSPTRIERGSTLLLTLPGHEARTATVIWWHAGIVGCAFDNLLTQREHDALLLRYGGDGEPAGR